MTFIPTHLSTAAAKRERITWANKFVLKIGGEFPRTATFAIGQDNYGRQAFARLCHHTGRASKVFNGIEEMRADYARLLKDGWKAA
jgi:hypothetical protein